MAETLANFFVDLFGNKQVLMSAKESFPMRQDILQKLMDMDYDGGEDKKIKFINDHTGLFLTWDPASSTGLAQCDLQP